jgi:hypothetical protein
VKDLSDWREGTLDETDKYFEFLRYALTGLQDVAGLRDVQMGMGNDYGTNPVTYEKLLSKEAHYRVAYMGYLAVNLRRAKDSKVKNPRDYSDRVAGKNRQKTMAFSAIHNLKLSDAAKKKGTALHKEALVAVKALQRCEDLLQQIIGGMNPPKAATNKKKTARRRVIRR